jgi:hypothetical protein
MGMGPWNIHQADANMHAIWNDSAGAIYLIKSWSATEFRPRQTTFFGQSGLVVGLGDWTNPFNVFY